MEKTRYSLSVDFYIYADDDQDAMKQATKWVEKQKSEKDNQAMILNLHHCPFASLTAREIYNVSDKTKK